ncbi:PilW family protein [Aeromonas veronii]|uniref:PilW family protein n=1 Tax=Aeromonas veronii TaxID=654 RepID=UPI0023571D26|nr:prepilin-type N-terminal cleavage/methylation domain-containing protein [Aeromonas veronii]
MLSIPSRQLGVSLVELMISMVLGLMLMLAIFAGYALRDPLIFRDSNNSKCAGV